MPRFYFAFVDSTDSIFNNTFKRNDADVFSFELIHEEGLFARLEIEIKNPRVGLLSTNRKQWCWLSYENGQLFSQLFFGRMVGTPQEIEKELIKLTFVAKPKNFEASKSNLANSLKTLPNFDPVWIAPEKRNDPESVLESIPKLWHIDRVSHNLTISDINSGEDGVINIGDDFFYNSLNINFTSPPLFRIDVEGTVSWTEEVNGSFDLSSKFPRPIETMTGQGLLNDWPEFDENFGGGWSFGLASISRVDGLTFPITFEIFTDPNTKDLIGYPVWKFLVNQIINYKATRRRQETVKFSLVSDMQRVFSESGEDAVEKFTIVSDEIDKLIDDNNNLILSNVNRTYFKTIRGKQSLEYLLAVAKTKLISRARAVEITAETKFENGLNLSCRKDIALTDTRISSTGAAIGKIKSYSLYANGETGELGCKFTIGCTIGNGSLTIVSSGTPSYVNSGYASSGYQFFSGSQFQAMVGGVTYNDFSNAPINDDGIDFSNYRLTDAFNSLTIYMPYSQQIIAIRNAYNALYSGATSSSLSSSQITTTINNYPTQIKLKMNPISEGPFETTYNIITSNLSIPKTINLEN